MRLLMIVSFILSYTLIFTQELQLEITKVQQEISDLEEQRKIKESVLTALKQQKIIYDLKEIGLPHSRIYIEHSAMIIEYSETHEQAKWVAHMILPDIVDGSIYRTNDFREDPKVLTGTAVQEDYFLTDTLADGTVEYDGYGYDRGHLAPSADFRWSQEALSESYFYSNMSPQLPEFNREKWAELESFLRDYVIQNNVPLYILTAPIFGEDPSKISQSINDVSIPVAFAKAAYDPINKQAIAFYMENEASKYPLQSFVKTINDIEQILGFELFLNVESNIKSNVVSKSWFDNNNSEVVPIHPPSLPPNHFNTVQVSNRIGKESIVCGTIVSTKYSRKGNLWLNVDKKFPNQPFSLYIPKDQLVNFPFDPEERFKNQKICSEGKVEKINKVPTIKIHSSENIWLYN